jgi:alkanesulfonate monooxygenase SsuD/methylene tetrahydromethanopterin reductase-like flavin-dependent oxidoreductase (luciferase family)
LPRQGFRQRFREGTEIVRRAWAGGPRWSFHGEAYDLDDVALLPGPAQAGGPPIWVAGQGEWSVRFAVEAGDGYAGDPFPMLPSVWSDRVARFREGAAGRGVARPEVAMLRHVFVTDDRAEARRVLAEVCLPQFRFYEDAGLLEGRLPPGARVDEDVVAATAVAGPIDECASRLAEAAEQYDLTYLIVKVMRPHDLEPARELAMVEALGAAVPRSLRRNLCST